MTETTSTKAPKRQGRRETISDRFLDAVESRLSQNKQVRRALPFGGRLHIDRQLPFLCAYRRPLAEADDGFHQLVNSEASYLFAAGLRQLQPGLQALVARVARIMGAEFGGFLLVEVWADQPDPADRTAKAPETAPGFTVFAPRSGRADALLDTLCGALGRVTVQGRSATVRVVPTSRIAPSGMAPLLAAKNHGPDCIAIGLGVAPIHRDPKRAAVFPIVLRELERELTRALRQVFYDFAQKHTTHRPRHFHGMGRHAMVKATWEVDRQLASVSSSFDFLLQVTPANSDEAWRRFKKDQYATPPALRYRPLSFDPHTLKRALFSAPIERLEDPAIQQIFIEKLDELDRRLTMLLDIDTPRFRHGSAQLFGELNPATVELSGRILDSLPSRTRDEPKRGALSAAEFAALAETELSHYREQHPDMTASVQLRSDISGLMVSRGNLLVSRSTKIPRARADALIQHEIGTHIVTYYNGKAQPFRQLYSGLAGYDAMQEGLAVFAEYLTGGLTRPRLRLLAARVIAVHRLLDGAGFVDTFRELDRDYDFERRTAFNVTMRVYRGGGLTKDAVYLQGLVDLLGYLAQGGDLDTLLVGKMSVQHVPIIEELLWRKVLKPPPLRPRFLDWPGAAARLARARGGASVLDLVAKRGPR